MRKLTPCLVALLSFVISTSAEDYDPIPLYYDPGTGDVTIDSRASVSGDLFVYLIKAPFDYRFDLDDYTPFMAAAQTRRGGGI